MAPKYTYRVEKNMKRELGQHLRNALSLDSEAGRNRIEKIIMELEDESAPEHLAARDLTVNEVVKIFGLKAVFQPWNLQRGGSDVPEFLTSVLGLINNTPFDETSEAYSRLMIDLLILACFTEHQKNFSKQSELSTNDPTTTTSPSELSTYDPTTTTSPSKLSTNDPTTTTSPILKQSELSTNNPTTTTSPTELSTNDPTTTTSPILKQSELPTKDPYNQTTPTSTPSKTLESTSQPLPITVFHEMHLSVQVERGGIKRVVSGIADWAMGYGERAVLEDGTVMLAIEAKRRDLFSSAEQQLLAYLAIIRQLRIQANKENVMTQGFYSDGRRYTFICIRNDGTVMASPPYDLFHKRYLKTVFNSLLSMLTTAANSSPNTSPMKPGKERDEKITNLDQDVFVRVIEDQDMYDDADIAEEDESCRLSITKTKVV